MASWAEETRIGMFERAMEGLNWLAQRRGLTETQPAHLLAGVEGEDVAYFYLRRKGYIVTARRWSGGNLPGDLDLIAWQWPLLCFVEAKTRTAHDMAAAEASIDEHKRKVLRRLARHYIRQLPGGAAPQARFDVISVYLVPGQTPEVVHFENAFGWSERRLD